MHLRSALDIWFRHQRQCREQHPKKSLWRTRYWVAKGKKRTDCGWVRNWLRVTDKDPYPISPKECCHPETQEGSLGLAPTLGQHKICRCSARASCQLHHHRDMALPPRVTFLDMRIKCGAAHPSRLYGLLSNAHLSMHQVCSKIAVC